MPLGTAADSSGATPDWGIGVGMVVVGSLVFESASNAAHPDDRRPRPPVPGRADEPVEQHNRRTVALDASEQRSAGADRPCHGVGTGVALEGVARAPGMAGKVDDRHPRPG